MNGGIFKEGANLDNQAQHWKEVIFRHGISCLSGKFRPTWTIDGVVIGGEEGAFLDINPVGLSRVNLGQFGADKLIDQAISLPTDRYYWLAGRSTAPESYAGKQIGLPQETRPLTFLMFSHRDSTPDSRHNHSPLAFSIFLPSSTAAELFEAVGEAPLFIENIFQLTFPGLVGPEQLQRVRAAQLATFDLRDAPTPQGERYEYTKTLIKSGGTVRDFPHPIGERDG